MAIDYKDLQVTVDEFQEQLSNLKDLIRVGREGKVAVALIGDINFTAAQKTGLVASYDSIKSAMVVIFNNLP